VNVSKALNAASAGITAGQALANGDIASALMATLPLVLSNLLQDSNQVQAQLPANAPPIVSPENISPTPDMLGHPAALAFVGGFGDSTLASLSNNLGIGSGGLMARAEQDYAHAATGTGANVAYFTWDQQSDLQAWIQQNGGHVTVIAHSWGADTAAQIVASGVHVDTLVTLDPVSTSRPNLNQVAANSGQWLNFVAAGGGLTVANAIAATGGAWGNSTQGFATRTIDVNVDHASIANRQMMTALVGLYQ
jgi:pimeloyl-ACP methyl ester carboxylesterase